MRAFITVKCEQVSHTDRIALFFPKAPGAVAYTFDPNAKQVLTHHMKNASAQVQIGDSIAFDTLTFPYDFSFRAFVDTGE